MKQGREYGDITMVQRMSKARGMGRDGRGYSYDTCKRVLNGTRRNAGITELYRELAALRTPKRTRR